MIIYREITPSLIRLSQQFPIVGVIGPRQSGKTTLVRQTFKEYAYVTLEDVDMRRAARDDPRQFLAAFAKEKGVILDEIQEVPELFSYLQGIVDQEYKPGFFIITGSQNFLMMEKVTQSLAGRIALLTLLPLTVDELRQAKLLPARLEDLLIKGCYPGLYAHPIDYHVWYNNYIATYVERDVRQVLKVTDVISFQRFIKLCAARVGNIINYADLARDADISPNTAKAWISILETSYIIFLLTPYYKNFSKRMIKSPKMYFYDTGLVCSLLNIRSPEELFLHAMRGGIFESFILSELFKYRYNQNEKPNLYFWRDVQGYEADVIFEKSFDAIIPVEIKSSMTFSPTLFKGLIKWQKVVKQEGEPSYLVYAGDRNMAYQQTEAFAWDHVNTLVTKLEE